MSSILTNAFTLMVNILDIFLWHIGHIIVSSFLRLDLDIVLQLKQNTLIQIILNIINIPISVVMPRARDMEKHISMSLLNLSVLCIILFMFSYRDFNACSFSFWVSSTVFHLPPVIFEISGFP